MKRMLKEDIKRKWVERKRLNNNQYITNDTYIMMVDIWQLK
jgi:hypothetical protein